MTGWQSTTSLVGDGPMSNPGILYIRSTDNGLSWSEPAPLHDTYETDVVVDEAPTVAVASNGRWTAAWHAKRLTDEGFSKALIEHDICAM